ncbi:hypothetical protein CDAR_45791 [Caerostris darwini]|uniref:Uncharacterized protein n=1 Tax=Caerostris darwini TaxID=1538125 RepID=A0AAV4W517_9ARAC|nr:hypothetical protein CDAR_45791 [Caerostris darwini]
MTRYFLRVALVRSGRTGYGQSLVFLGRDLRNASYAPLFRIHTCPGLAGYLSGGYLSPIREWSLPGCVGDSHGDGALVVSITLW